MIVKDFLKVKEYLGLPDNLELHITFDTDEGFYRSNVPAVMIGTKNGYNRTLLVHMCLHAFGLSHYDEADFCGDIDYDLHSKRVEKQIFYDCSVPTKIGEENGG